MSNNKEDRFTKKCEICARSTRDERRLGPFIETKTIAAHYNCVIYSPVAPDKTDVKADGIAGVTNRFIRNEGKRAKALVSILFCSCIKILSHRSIFHSSRYVCTASRSVRILGAAEILGTTPLQNSAFADTTLIVV